MSGALLGGVNQLKWSILSSIDKLPMIIADFLQRICALTGWQSTFWAGGPCPKDGGGIKTISIHSCGDEEGLSFGDYLTRFDDGGLKQFSQFLHRVYRMLLFLVGFKHMLIRLTASEARRSRALPLYFKDGNSEKTDSEDDLVAERRDVHMHASASGTDNSGAAATSASSSETANSGATAWGATPSGATALGATSSGATAMGASVSGAINSSAAAMRASGSDTGNSGATFTTPVPTIVHQLFDGRTGGTGSSEGAWGDVPLFNKNVDLLGLMGDMSDYPQPVISSSSMFDGWGNFSIGGQTDAPQNWNTGAYTYRLTLRSNQYVC